MAFQQWRIQTGIDSIAETGTTIAETGAQITKAKRRISRPSYLKDYVCGRRC